MSDFAIAEVFPGKLNALVKNIMKQTGVSDPNEAVRLINSGECVISRLESRWREEDGVIYFTLISDGTTGPEWIERTKKRGNRLTEYAEQVLNSPEFVPTNGEPYRVAVLKGMLFNDNERITKNIRAEANRRGLETPNAELVCLIREAFTNEELEAMGLVWILCMHEPIEDTDGGPRLLVGRRLDGGRWLNAYYGNPHVRWNRSDGFAFVVPQVGSQH